MPIKPKRFFGLHAHTGYSVADGLGSPKQHFDFAMENGLDGMAITDHGHMNSYADAQSWYEQYQKEGKKFKYIPGIEAYAIPSFAEWMELKRQREIEKEETKKDKKRAALKKRLADDDGEGTATIEDENESKRKVWDPLKRRHHLVVLAKNDQGLKDLFRLSSLGYDQQYYFPRIDYSQFKKAKGNLVASTACVDGEAIVETNCGKQKLADIPMLMLDFNVCVLTRNESTGTLEEKPVVKAWKTGRKMSKLIRLKNGKELRLTADHKVMTQRGMVEVQQLQDDDKILCIKE